MSKLALLFDQMTVWNNEGRIFFLFLIYVHWCFACVSVLGTMELELETVTSHAWVLGIEPGSSGKNSQFS